MTETSFISQSHQETIKYGRMIGQALLPGCVIGLIGELGSGKTCLMKGIAAAMIGIQENEVTSPTFTILQQYEGKIPLYHFDLYRIKGVDDLEDIGLEEYLSGEGVTVIEWADRITNLLLRPCLIITITFAGETRRSFTMQAHGEKHGKIIKIFRTKLREQG